MRTRVVLVTLLIASACRSADKQPAPPATQTPPVVVDAALARVTPPLRQLNESTAAAFRATFDELAAHPRYVVALSPT